MRFSERSFSFVRRSWYSCSSSSGVPPRRRVPLIGLASTTPAGSIAKKRSGDELNTAEAGKFKNAAYGAGFVSRKAR